MPTLIVTIVLWLIIGLMVLLVDPNQSFAIPLFLVFWFLALLFTFSILFINTRRGALVALVLTVFLMLRLLGVDNWFNFILVIAIAIIIDRIASR